MANSWEGFSIPDVPEFDDWMTIQRETWHRRSEKALERLSRLQIESGKLRSGSRDSDSLDSNSPLQ